jgi:hypothetical protein
LLYSHPSYEREIKRDRFSIGHVSVVYLDFIAVFRWRIVFVSFKIFLGDKVPAFGNICHQEITRVARKGLPREIHLFDLFVEIISHLLEVCSGLFNEAPVFTCSFLFDYLKCF